ncbi:MAG TPA: HXXEE domain-containing protein [Opitutaceae bacterium]|nr:HXXEE domain-containing protein [Opitutaceae bacterium]
MNAPSPVSSDERRPEAVLRFGRAWLALAAALALHVTDEALTNFLAFYNPTVRAIRDRLPWIPLPTFSFRVWIAGLVAGIALLFLLSPVAFRGAKWLTVIAVPFSVMMVGNGLGHVGSSIYFGRFMPGVYSSPILIAASLWALVSALRLLRTPGNAV